MRTCLVGLGSHSAPWDCAEGLAPAAEPTVAIGSRVPNLTFKDIRYLNRSLDDFPKAKAFALVFVDAGCPLAQRYLPTLQQIEADYRDKGVVLLAVDSGPADSIPATAALAVRHGCTFPFVKDFDAVCARAVGVTRTPECVVLDADRKLRYRGRIDDQYRLDRRSRARRPRTSCETPSTPSSPARRSPSRRRRSTAARSPGPTPPDKKGVTFAKDVAPILKAHCQECHRPGTVAPFSLQTYEQVKARAKTIAEVVADGRMPPWHAAPEFEFVNRRGLSATSANTLLAWLRSSDRPRGDDRVAPEPLPPAGEWRIGKPDFVVTAAEHTLPAAGDVPYQYALLPTCLPARHLGARRSRSSRTTPRVMHHCNMAYVKPGEKFRHDNFITGQVPGGDADDPRPTASRSRFRPGRC